MTASIITNGIIYALSNEFSRQSLHLSVSKVFQLLDYFTKSPNEEICDFLEVENFISKKHIRLKLSTAEEIIKEKKIINNKNKAVEITCAALHESIIKIYRELEILKNIFINHKKKYFYWLRTPNYSENLKKIDYLLKNDFEVCFSWLIGVVQVSF
jgi:hypothetical protein